MLCLARRCLTTTCVAWTSRCFYAFPCAAQLTGAACTSSAVSVCLCAHVLVSQVATLNCSRSSVLLARANTARFQQQTDAQNGVLGLERCASEVVARIRNELDSIRHSEDVDEASTELQLSLLQLHLPEMLHYIRLMCHSDAAEAAGLCDDFRAILYGPKNRRTYNPHSLRDNVLRYLAHVSHDIRAQLSVAGSDAVVPCEESAVEAAFSEQPLPFPVFPG
jgi:hypothetical protein